MSSWRERSHCRPSVQKRKGAKPAQKIQGPRRRTPEWRPRSESFSNNSDEDTDLASRSTFKLPPTPREDPTPNDEPLVAPPIPEEPAAPPELQEYRCPCLLCDFHITGDRLNEMEAVVEQMVQEEGSSQQKRWQSTLHRLPYSNIWPDNIYINRSHRLY